MSPFQTPLEIDETRIAARVIDGEAILIDLESGHYHSIDGVGGIVWNLIESGHTPEQIEHALSLRFEGSAERIAEDLERLVGQMIDADLVTPSEAPIPDPPDELDSDLSSYVTPRLRSYDDLAEVLALDPPMPGLGGVFDPEGPGSSSSDPE